MTIEREISSIETANINKETLNAMKNASAAMKQIHGGLTIDKVDQTMYVATLTTCALPHSSFFGRAYTYPKENTLIGILVHREDLRDQHAIGEEIAEALKQGSVGQGVDEDELEDELADLQQEELDKQMLNTGTVPVADKVHQLPAVAHGEREFYTYTLSYSCASVC